MTSEWHRIPFGEFVSLQRGHDLPEQEREDGNVPILGSFGVTGWHSTAKAKAPGLTIGRSGASFGVATYTDKDYFPLNTTLYVTDFNGNNPRFAYYFAKNFDFTAFNSGSAQPSLNRNFINPVEVSIPPRAEQKAIAHILGTLDDKIELNRKTNETLEAMAKAPFKSWFVDFDPVSAKAEGRPTGLPAEISDLFPDSFEDSELGEIPSGWEVFSLDQMLDTISETLPLMEREKVVFLNTGDILNGEFLVSECVSSRGLPGQAKKSIKKGDILFSEIRPGNGRHAFVYFDSYDYVVSTKLMVLRSRNRLDSLFEYFLITLSSSIQILQILAESRSGTFPQITFSELSSIKYPLPASQDLINIFDAQFLRLFHERSTLLRHQNILLSQTRDTLLPKLISGELRIPDAEKLLEEVGI